MFHFNGRGAMGRACRALAAAFALLCFGVAGPAMAQSSFYRASDQELIGKPGTLIRQEPVAGAPLDASAYRVLYRSTGLKGEPIAVSGIVVVPEGPVPPGGRPIVAWAHPTTGIVPHCAPSLALFKFQQIQGLRNMVSRGYIVAATDYPGLGTAGPHPYLVGISEGRAVLDSVRAAREIAGPINGHRVAVWGHSQGGQAALYAGLIAKTYAPELNLVGIAAAAPATELGTLMSDDIATPGGKNLLAMTLWSWSRVYGAPLDKFVDAGGIATMNSLAEVCLESPIDISPRRRAGEALQKDFLKVDDLPDVEPWRRLLAENTVGALPPSIPIFLAQGSIDDTIRPTVTHDYMRKLCAAGSKVRLLTLQGVNHGPIAMKSALLAVAWIADRFAGLPAPTDCTQD
jgi:acetyl esterase/lipase